MTSTKPKAQRLAESSRERAAQLMRSPLSKDLASQYGISTVSIRKGDTVMVVRGDYKGHEGKINTMELARLKITVEGVNTKKLDGTTKPVYVSPSKVKVTKLDLSDKMRKQSLEDISSSKKSK